MACARGGAVLTGRISSDSQVRMVSAYWLQIPLGRAMERKRAEYQRKGFACMRDGRAVFRSKAAWEGLLQRDGAFRVVVSEPVSVNPWSPLRLFVAQKTAV